MEEPRPKLPFPPLESQEPPLPTASPASVPPMTAAPAPPVQSPPPPASVPPLASPAPPPMSPPPEAAPAPRADNSLAEYLGRRVDGLEAELARAREHAVAVTQKLEEQEIVSREVEAHLKKISDEQKQERLVRSLEKQNQAAIARADALEKRLEEMSRTWAAMLRDASAQRQAGMGAISAELSALSSRLNEMSGTWTGLLQGALTKREAAQSFAALSAGLEAELKPIHEALKRYPAELEERVKPLDEMLKRYGENIVLRLSHLGNQLGAKGLPEGSPESLLMREELDRQQRQIHDLTGRIQKFLDER